MTVFMQNVRAITRIQEELKEKGYSDFYSSHVYGDTAQYNGKNVKIIYERDINNVVTGYKII